MHTAQFQALLLALIALISLAVAGQPLNQDYSCSKLLKRMEWRALNVRQRKNYIAAIQCLQHQVATSSFVGVKTRFDDFQALHIHLADQVHFVGHFLPWHRRFVGVFEQALRDECGYTGAQPYWDWTKDASDATRFQSSPVFDSHAGFGGLRGDANGCVANGPFRNYTLSLGIGQVVNDHCLTRNFRKDVLPFLTMMQVANTTKQPTFEQFRTELEGDPASTPKIHDSGHLVIGGDMSDLYSSPGDPLFYLHHANLDRIWWLWQQEDASKRLYQISGRSTVEPPYKNVTLDFPLDMVDEAEVLRIKDVMDIRRRPLCYEYI
uniref:Tyrosinase n=1 Tax=Macrocybe gigantea TaxID=1491104 RepID=A0A2K8JTS4_MACGN|nr:tyrosinase [Macrocybe gigantea]